MVGARPCAGRTLACPIIEEALANDALLIAELGVCEIRLAHSGEQHFARLSLPRLRGGGCPHNNLEN
eukprot:7147840-Lingulodinium_polyedra.AAC.1